VIVKKETDSNEGERGEPGEPGHGSLLLNIGKTVFLIAVLVAAWFILENLIGCK
jgi:hypothetical protein